MNYNQLFHFEYKTNKEDASFIYFTFESNEGIAFYSTLDHEEGQLDRVIQFNVPAFMLENFNNLIDHLSKRLKLKLIRISCSHSKSCNL